MPKIPSSSQLNTSGPLKLIKGSDSTATAARNSVIGSPPQSQSQSFADKLKQRVSGKSQSLTQSHGVPQKQLVKPQSQLTTAPQSSKVKAQSQSVLRLSTTGAQEGAADMEVVREFTCDKLRCTLPYVVLGRPQAASSDSVRGRMLFVCGFTVCAV